MKKLIAIFSLLSAPLFANDCLNYTGMWQGNCDGNALTIKMEQKLCESMKITVEFPKDETDEDGEAVNMDWELNFGQQKESHGIFGSGVASLDWANKSSNPFSQATFKFKNTSKTASMNMSLELVTTGGPKDSLTMTAFVDGETKKCEFTR